MREKSFGGGQEVRKGKTGGSRKRIRKCDEDRGLTFFFASSFLSLFTDVPTLNNIRLS